jgi:hypothetical protein
MQSKHSDGSFITEVLNVTPTGSGSPRITVKLEVSGVSEEIREKLNETLADRRFAIVIAPNDEERCITTTGLMSEEDLVAASCSLLALLEEQDLLGEVLMRFAEKSTGVKAIAVDAGDLARMRRTPPSAN